MLLGNLACIKMSERREFMKLPDLSDFRSKRELFNIELRKKQRTDETMKRRVKHHSNEDWRLAVQKIIPDYTIALPLTDAVRGLRDTLLNAQGLAQLQECVLAVRYMLAVPAKSPIKEVVEGGLVPILARILDLTQYPAEIAVRSN